MGIVPSESRIATADVGFPCEGLRSQCFGSANVVIFLAHEKPAELLPINGTADEIPLEFFATSRSQEGRFPLAFHTFVDNFDAQAVRDRDDGACECGGIRVDHQI